MDKEPGTGVLLTNAIVNYTGGVYWPAPAIFKTSCSLVITHFPFDEQTCTMKFGPWAYLGNEVIMRQVAGNLQISYSLFTPISIHEMCMYMYMEMTCCTSSNIGNVKKCELSVCLCVLPVQRVWRILFKLVLC